MGYALWPYHRFPLSWRDVKPQADQLFGHRAVFLLADVMVFVHLPVIAHQVVQASVGHRFYGIHASTVAEGGRGAFATA